MIKRYIIVLFLALSMPLFSKQMGQAMAAINFAGGPSYYIGFSSTKVDSRNHIPGDITDASFALNQAGDRVATFYIYWKVYVTDPVSIDIIEMTDLESANASGVSIGYSSTSLINGNTLTSGLSTKYRIYEESNGSKTVPRINSEQIELKLDIDQATLEKIASLSDENKNFSGSMTIELTVNT